MSVQKKAPKIKDYNGNIFIAFFRSLNLGLANFWRNKFLSFATILVIAVIIFIFNIILAVQFIGNKALQSLSERVDIVIYLRDDIENYDANNLTETIRGIAGVKDVKYTSKEDALDIVSKTHPKTAEFLQKFNIRNPLPPSISITTASPEDHAKIQQFLEQGDYKNMMQNYVTEEASGQSGIISTVAKNLANISQFVRQLIFWMILVFILGGTLVIVNAIQLTIYTRRHEIYIMRLVGATPNFIRTPFIFEGILYGTAAVILSFCILSVLGNNIMIEDSNLWTYYESLNLYNIFIYELGITLVLSIICSYSAAQQYIKGKLSVN